MNTTMKFAAQERGSARTLVLVPGSRPVMTAASAAPIGVRGATAHGAVANGLARDAAAGAEVAVPTAAGQRDVRTASYRVGQKVFGPGGGAGMVYLVRSGCVALFKALPGRRSICVGLLGPDDVFLQESGRGGLPVTGLTAEVLVDTTVAAVEIDALPRLMAASPELAATIVGGFAQRLTGVQGLVEQLLSRDITLRLASALLILAERFGEAPNAAGFAPIALPVPHKLLARLIGANRVTVTRVITELRGAGLVESRGRNQLSVEPARVRAYVLAASRQSLAGGR
jgi:CRP-like cAMP-binding protein